MKQRKRKPMTQMLKRAARARREHGIALLFTLCILSMALITAMIFSSSSSTSRKVAAAYIDSSSARILADGVVSRAILSLMQSENVSYVCSYYNTSKPGGGTSAEYASDWIWKMERPGLFEFNNGPLRFRNTTYYDSADSRCPSWEYVTTRKGYDYPGNSTPARIFGRYAYVAIGQNDQLNPNAIGKTKYSDFNDDTFKKRLGRWTCEPDFIFNFTGSNNRGTYKDEVNPTKIREKYASLSDNWTDTDIFVSDLVGDEPDNHLKMMVDQYFDVSSQGEYNKFRPDGTAIGDLSKHELATGEEYRFPLIRNDWSSIGVDTLREAIPWFRKANTKQVNVNQTIANLINYNAPESRQAVSDADWFSGEPSYTGNKRTPYINEVHADIVIGGNLGFPMREPYWEDPSNPASRKWRLWYTDCTYSHEITLNVETVNLYGNDALSVKPPILVGEISYEYCTNADLDGHWVSGNTQTIRFDAGNQPWSAPAVSVSDDKAYTLYTYMVDSGSIDSVTTPKREGYSSPVGHEGDFYGYIKIRNVKVRLDRVVLQDNAGNADLALMPDSLSMLPNGHQYLGATEEKQVAGTGDSGQHYYFDTQINDPRFNLARDLWSKPTFQPADDTNATLRGFNSGVVKYSKNDPNNYDPGEDPEHNIGKISTAYIRHKPMQSLWELGAIHRGAPWQTINLKCASTNGTAMEAYSKGDGHLLDQVALASSTDRTNDSVLGLINLNCVATFGGGSAPFAFKSLFTNFPVYRTFENMYKDGDSGQTGLIKGDSVDSDKTGNMDADAFAKDLSEAVTYAISHGNLPRRTAVFPTSYPASDSQMDHIIKRNVPDAEAEEIFCRVVNLLKWNKQPLKRATILVLAQTIRDIGGATLRTVLPSADHEDDLWRDSGFQTFDSTKHRTSASSITTDTLRGYEQREVKLNQYDNFYDQITGEAKVIVRLEWDESANDNKGAWKITRKEYAE